jgi:hypothetical protein
LPGNAAALIQLPQATTTFVKGQKDREKRERERKKEGKLGVCENLCQALPHPGKGDKEAAFLEPNPPEEKEANFGTNSPLSLQQQQHFSLRLFRRLTETDAVAARCILTSNGERRGGGEVGAEV